MSGSKDQRRLPIVRLRIEVGTRSQQFYDIFFTTGRSSNGERCIPTNRLRFEVDSTRKALFDQLHDFTLQMLCQICTLLWP